MANPAKMPDSVFDSPTDDETTSSTIQKMPDSVFDTPQGQEAQNVPGSLASSGQVLLNAAKDVPIGLLNKGQDIGQFLHQHVSSIFPQTNMNVSAALGVPNPTTADSVIQGLSGYAPAGALGELGAGAGMLGKMGAQGLAGLVYGGSQATDPGMNALKGAGTNMVLSGAGNMLGAVPNAVQSYLSKFSGKGLGDLVDSGLQGAKSATNQQAFEAAANNLKNNWEPKEEQAWDEAHSQFKQADAALTYGISPDKEINPSSSTDLTAGTYAPSQQLTSPGQTLEGQQVPNFDNADYVNSLKAKKSSLQGQSNRQSAMARTNSAPIDLLNGYINDQHGTFTDAIEHNQALNQDYKNEITPGKSVPFDIVNFAKAKLAKTINDNLDANGLQDTAGAAWKNANSITAQKNQIFNQLYSPSGRQQISSFSQMVKPNATFNDPTGFVNDYLPKARGDGIQKMDQFTQMVGDPTLAKNVLKNNYFGNSFSNSGGATNIPKFLTKFNNLSSEQQNYLFQPDELQNIQAANKLNDNYKGSFNPQGGVSKAGHAIVPAMIGALAGAHAPGMSELLGAGLGMGAASMAGHGLTSYMSSPGAAKYFAKYLLAPTMNLSNTGVGRGLQQGVNSLLTPYATGQF